MKSEWEIKKLSEICEKITQGPNPKYDNKGSEKYKVLKTKNLYDNIIHYQEADEISEAVFKNFTSSELKNGDVLLAIVGQGSINKCNVFENKTSTKFIFTRALGLIRTNPTLLYPYFLRAFLQSQTGKRLIDSGINGTSGQQVVTTTHLKAIEIPLPPLSEQKRIVAILNEVFTSIDTAKANTEKNLQNAKELFESYVQGVFESKDEGWEERTIGNLSKNKDAVVSGPFGSNLKVSDYKEKGIPIFRLQNIGKGYFINKDIKYIDEEKAKELKYHSFVAGDIVLAKLGIPIGKTCIVPNYFKAGIITADVVRIRPDKNVVDYKFLEYFLNTNLSVAQLTNNISGATRPRVNLSDVRNIKLILPPLKTQLLIVQKLDTLSSQTKKLEVIYQQKLNDLEDLKQSILQKAFAGELTEKALV